VGLEDPQDLRADIAQALAVLRGVKVSVTSLKEYLGNSRLPVTKAAERAGEKSVKKKTS
jgi:hypothetical protein